MSMSNEDITKLIEGIKKKATQMWEADPLYLPFHDDYEKCYDDGVNNSVEIFKKVLVSLSKKL